MANQKIHEYPLERFTFGDDDYYDIDYWDGVTYQTAKILGSTIKAAMLSGIAISLTAPSAFNVGGSPTDGTGTLSLTAAGTANQYVRGDGTLATFPTSGGGGNSVNYYLNGGTAASVGTYFQMSKTPVLGTSVDFSLAGNGLISQWLTDINDPNIVEIPAGNWNFEMYFSASSSGGTPAFYIEILKYDGTTFTSIANNSANPEGITNGTATDLYVCAVPMPLTTLLPTDRIALRVYVVNSILGRTITHHTQDSNLSQVITTFSSGISSINGLTKQTQYLAVGTLGTDFNIDSTTDTHTFHLPTASATKRGALSSTDWSTFNGKQENLVSGTNIKTVNGTSLLGSGDITIGGGGLTVGTTAITSGTTTRLLLQVGSVVQQSAMLTLDDTGVAGSTTANFANTFKRVGNNFEIYCANGATNMISSEGGGTALNFTSTFQNVHTTGNNHNFRIGTASPVSAMYINSSRNVGVGTTSPAARLDVRAQGALSTDIAFRVRNSADTANLFEFSGDGTFRLGGTTSNQNGFSYLTDGRLFMAKSGSNFIELNPSAANRLYSTNGWEFEAVGTGKYLTFAANGAVRMRMIDGTIQIGSFNTSDNATNTMYFLNGTAPNTNHTDIFKIYSADIVAGNAAPHFRTENGSIIKLYKQDLPTNPTNAQIATFLSNLGLANLI